MLPAEKRTWRIIILVLLGAAAIYGMTQCGESSWYEKHAEKFNLYVIAIPLIILFVGGGYIWYRIANKKKK